MSESRMHPASRAPASRSVAAFRILFVEKSEAGQRVIRRFADPAASLAVAEEIPFDPKHDPAAGELYVVHVSTIDSPSGESAHRAVMGSHQPAVDETTPSAREVKIRTPAGKLFWMPGRVLVESADPPDDGLLAALAQFAYDEWHLRQLEIAVRRIEQGAPADAGRAYLPQFRDRRAWPRMIELARELAVLRLRAARLEPSAYSPPRDLAAPYRRLIGRLIARAAMEDRLEALSARLEACEDLYEAAVDRIAEQKGLRLERGIILLLSLETVLILVELAAAVLRGR